MTEYCPECGHVIPLEVGFGSSCGHCRWSGLVGSKSPRRDTRDDPEPVSVVNRRLAEVYDDGSDDRPW